MSNVPESKPPESELDLDLHFLPAWAQKPADINPYAKYKGEDTDPRDRDQRGRGDHRPRRDDRGGRGPRRDGPGGSPAGRPGGRPQGFQGDRGPGNRGPRRPDQRDFREPRETPPPLPDIDLEFLPEEKGVESLARQIKLTGRAYPLFEIAFLVLKKPERYHVVFSVVNKDGKPINPLFVCGLDDTLWLSEQEAVEYVLGKHFATFYQSEKLATDPPKGTYTFVAQCGLSGTILGPPNNHDYQNKIRKLHAERFARMPFETYKARIKIVKEEATVKKWLEDQSWKTEYIALNVPEPVRLATREEVEKHFRETHLPNVIKTVETQTLSGVAAQALPSRQMQVLLRRTWDDQMRFPLKIVTVLSQQFARHGLQFFKVNKTVTHVAVARPRYLDQAATPVSEGVKKIVDFVEATPRCTRRKLIEAFAPGSIPPKDAAPPSATAEVVPPTPEMAALISDLHWLIHQGHVIEFANGIMENAKKPPTKPERPQPAEKEAAATVEPAPVSAEGIVQEPADAAAGTPESAEAPATPAAEPAVEVEPAKAPDPTPLVEAPVATAAPAP